MSPSLTTRVVLAMLLVVAAFAAALGRGAAAQRTLTDEMGRLNDGYVVLLRGLDGARRELDLNARQFETSAPAALQETVRASVRLLPGTARVDVLLAALSERADSLVRTARTDEERRFLANFGVLLAEFRQENLRIGSAARDAITEAEVGGPTVRKRSELVRRLSALEKRMADATRLLEIRTEASFAAFSEQQRQLEWQNGLLVTLAVLISLVVTLLVARSLRPIADLTRAAGELQAGVALRLPERGGTDEVGRLVEAFGTMASAIDERDRRLRSQRDALETTYAELIEAQRARLEVERLAAVGAMSARVTHELRNPLSSLRLNAEMLADELREGGRDDEAKELLGSIRREIERLIVLTDEYLGLARESHPQDASAIDRVADEVARQFQSTLERAEIVLVTELADSPASIGDGPLRQVAINLLRNAVEAVSGVAGTRMVRLRSWTDGAGAHLRVDDSGPGVPEDLRARIFEPFVTTRVDGTGLGLNISRQIARAHGGSLELVESSDLGGASFELVVPAVGALPQSG